MEGNARELILNLAHRGEEHRTPAAAFSGTFGGVWGRGFDVADDQFLCKGTAAKRVAIRVCHCSRGNAKDRQGPTWVKQGQCAKRHTTLSCAPSSYTAYKIRGCMPALHPCTPCK